MWFVFWLILDFFCYLVYVSYHVPSVHSLPDVTPEDDMSVILVVVCQFLKNLICALVLVYLLVNYIKVDNQATTEA